MKQQVTDIEMVIQPLLTRRRMLILREAGVSEDLLDADVYRELRDTKKEYRRLKKENDTQQAVISEKQRQIAEQNKEIQRLQQEIAVLNKKLGNSSVRSGPATIPAYHRTKIQSASSIRIPSGNHPASPMADSPGTRERPCGRQSARTIATNVYREYAHAVERQYRRKVSMPENAVRSLIFPNPYSLLSRNMSQWRASVPVACISKANFPKRPPLR